MTRLKQEQNNESTFESEKKFALSISYFTFESEQNSHLFPSFAKINHGERRRRLYAVEGISVSRKLKILRIKASTCISFHYTLLMGSNRVLVCYNASKKRILARCIIQLSALNESFFSPKKRSTVTLIPDFLALPPHTTTILLGDNYLHKHCDLRFSRLGNSRHSHRS